MVKKRGGRKASNPVNVDKSVDNAHRSKLLSQLEDFRQEKRYTDIIIETKDKEFPAHKNVLAASSLFWVACFERGFKETTQNTIPLTHINSDTFEELLTYIYTGKIQIKAESVISLYELSDYLQYTSVKVRCLKFMLANVNHENCSHFLELSEKFTLVDLHKAAESFIIPNISTDTYVDFF